MLAKTLSAAIRGMDVVTVEIEVNYSSFGENTNSEQHPSITIVGLPDAAIRESRERIWSAMSQSGIIVKAGKTTINLAPADLRKSGTAYDLPIALCLMADLGRLPPTSELWNTMVIGELALGGAVRPIRGALPIAMHARDIGLRRIVVPEENAKEAAMAGGIEVYGVRNLQEAQDFFSGASSGHRVEVDIQQMFNAQEDDSLDFADVKGQESAKRAIVVAAAGSHNILMIGTPGTGKSLMAKRIPGILPPMSVEEALEVTKIHSIAGVLDYQSGLVVKRPFRSPHHTVSDGGLVGGSMNPRPGELSLAHNGVLFLDELPEFRRTTLEVLRQPLESGEVTLARASGTFVFPAKVMLVAAMNPCPCGYYGSTIRKCTCSPFQIAAYRSRLSGPLLDRVDLHIEVAPITHEQLIRKRQGMSTAQMREQVLRAREMQQKRFAGTKVRCNADMSGKMMDEFCELTPECADTIRSIVTDLKLSARAYDRILRVSRTLADLDGKERLEVQHIREASGYRYLDRGAW